MSNQVILEAVQQAIGLCRTVQEQFLQSTEKYSDEKRTVEPVTIADYGSQAIVSRAIAQHFPDDAIIAEESGEQFLDLVSPEQREIVVGLIAEIIGETVTEAQVVNWLDHGKGKKSERTWVIDPIDGTKGFVNLRHYAIAVGLLVDGVPQQGFMACPGYEEKGAIFYTDEGKAWQAELDLGNVQEIHTSTRTEPSEIVVVQSFEKQHASKSRMEIVRENAGLENAKLAELDSMEKYALVANGDADLYLRLPRLQSTHPHMIWDHAAGYAILIAAGGVATDINGTPLIFSDGHSMPNQGMIVCQPGIHTKLVEAVSKLLAEETTQFDAR